MANQELQGVMIVIWKVVNLERTKKQINRIYAPSMNKVYIWVFWTYQFLHGFQPFLRVFDPIGFNKVTVFVCRQNNDGCFNITGVASTKQNLANIYLFLRIVV